jgi:phosphohistidine phosphatase
VTDRDEISLHLIRHAHAGDPMKWHGPDALRPLSEKGRHQAERLGLFLADVGFAPNAILTSPRTRALDTARLVATPLDQPVVVVDALGGSLDLDLVTDVLIGAGSPRSVVLVGHDPDFSRLASELTGTPELTLRKGALIRIDAPLPLQSGRGIVRWLIPPDLLLNGERETD